MTLLFFSGFSSTAERQHRVTVSQKPYLSINSIHSRVNEVPSGSCPCLRHKLDLDSAKPLCQGMPLIFMMLEVVLDGRSLNAAKSSKNHIPSKVVVIILLVCVILTTLAFLASVACYFCRRNKFPIQPPLFSSDKETSCNSATNLISHKSSSVFETKINMDSPINKGTGCFTSCLLRANTSYTWSNYSIFDLVEVAMLSWSAQRWQNRAVKRLKAQQGPDSDSVFITEIEMLSRLHHYHVVPLLGYCFETHGKNAERLLVFEYMNNGNLRDCLDGDEGKNMDWGTRVAIAIGAARGLEYLHEAAAPRILHRDVKSTNILLDENWQAKITDLGMAKRLKADGLPSASSSPARMQGTFGYFAPEYAIVGRASLKSDVFSFGVVLLELITGRKPIHKSSSKGEESLVIWATPRLQDSRRVITELADPDLAGNFPEEEMQIMAFLAKECLLLDPDARPNMSEVVQILSTIVPERSKRRNFPVNLFQHMGTDGHKDAEELRRARSSKGSVRCSLPLDIDRNLCAERRTDTVSDNYMERLILLTSNARSWRASDDETVDLTEPRFESFCLANAKPL
ncbi:Protein kinase superfamily protein [Prunus dulcis]|uniref:non-specific serine/threonine protein kinase n=1 Tax=Prunus dulcis TaxID=3755 RepID=A0A4Y1RM64_PRUDU|nr:Protein kinase superfamily protein [Prunus dulcis]